MTKLKLSAIPDDGPVKITVELPGPVVRDHQLGRFIWNGAFWTVSAANNMPIFQGSSAGTGGYEVCTVNLLTKGDNIVGNELTRPSTATTA